MIGIALPFVDQRGLQHALAHMRTVRVIVQYAAVIFHRLRIVLQVDVRFRELEFRIGGVA